MMIQSESIKQIAPALLVAQKAIGYAKEGATNPFFKSNYADLGAVIEAVKEPLNNAGIAFVQGVDETEGGEVVETRLIHESGEWIGSRTPIKCTKPNDPQSMGSGITYSKRYALAAICGLPTLDDDGEGAQGRGKTTTKAKPTTTPAAKPAARRNTRTQPPPATGVTLAEVKTALAEIVAASRNCDIPTAKQKIGGFNKTGKAIPTIAGMLELAGAMGFRSNLAAVCGLAEDGEELPSA